VEVYRLIETIIVAALVTGSALWLFELFAPKVSRGLRSRVAVRLNQRGRPRPMRVLAAKLAAVPSAREAGCASGCSTCGGCGLSRVSPATADERAR
jgi:hypothetical protein